MAVATSANSGAIPPKFGFPLEISALRLHFMYLLCLPEFYIARCGRHFLQDCSLVGVVEREGEKGVGVGRSDMLSVPCDIHVFQGCV